MRLATGGVRRALLARALRLSAPPTMATERPPGAAAGWTFQNRGGEVVKRFHVVIRADWKGDTGTLDEDFTRSDGATSKRVWTLMDLGQGRYQGRANDVIRLAEGRAAGHALNWRYGPALPVDGTTHEVNVDDGMFLLDNVVMLNRAVMSKWGFRLGEVTLAFKKRSES